MKLSRIFAKTVYKSLCLFVGRTLIAASQQAPIEAKATSPAPKSATVPTSETIELREGLHIVLTNTKLCSPQRLFQMAVASSAMLSGKPVHCTGLLPGVSLHIHVRQHDPQQLATLADQLWTQVQPQLERWIDIAEQLPCLNVPINGINVTFALDRQITLNKGVMQIEARPAWNGQAKTAATPT